jgi:hypothetical protein
MYDLKSIRGQIDQLIKEKEQLLKVIWGTENIPFLCCLQQADAIHKLYEPAFSRLDIAFKVAEWHMVNSQMISISERMPEENQYVLVLYHETFIHCVFSGGAWFQITPTGVRKFDDGENGIRWYSQEITHWMPLPSIPPPMSNAD